MTILSCLPPRPRARRSRPAYPRQLGAGAVALAAALTVTGAACDAPWGELSGDSVPPYTENGGHGAVGGGQGGGGSGGDWSLGASDPGGAGGHGGEVGTGGGGAGGTPAGGAGGVHHM